MPPNTAGSADQDRMQGSAARRSRRGSETRQRTKLVNLRLTDAEQVDLRARAAAEGIPVAAYIRKRVFA